MTACSIVIPVHNHASMTRQCLDGLLRGPGAVSAEIVVVDDGSTDMTPAVLAEYGGRIRVVRRERNGGFAAACNDGAAAATGGSLVFLNNDTMPVPGWLEALERYAAAHAAAAVVGCKLLQRDGTIQHAGTVVGQDRYTRHIYKGFPADHPAVTRSRRFQIVTGAAMLVRREAFDAVGGFDTAFVNAYEDHDLCLRLGERGHEIHYCHESVLYHLEGVTRASRTQELERATRLYRLRWAHRLRPDDLGYYAEDGLLQVTYTDSYPVRLHVSPLLATLSDGVRAMEADRLLDARAVQVRELLREQAELSARVLAGDARAHARPDGAALSTAGAAVALERPAATGGTTAAAVATDVEPDPCPPPHLVRLVGGQFAETGEEFLQYFLHLGGLRPTDKVLEVGCGAGRMAVPLTHVLADGGSYDGFDVVAEAVAWCRQAITPRFPHFRFRHADVRSGFYNPDAPAEAGSYVFPHASGSKDFVLLTSVFTHLLPRDLDHYLDEIARVLRPGGTCFATFFLFNEESARFVRAGFAPGFGFVHHGDGYRTLDAATPEAAVAYDEAAIRTRLAARELRIVEPVRYGHWCGRPDGLSLQDIIVATRA